MTDSPSPETGTTKVARQSHYAAALDALDGAGRADASTSETLAFGALASAHAQMLLANEARVANLIAYLAVVTGPGAQPDEALVRELERRIDAALGTTTEAPRA